MKLTFSFKARRLSSMVILWLVLLATQGFFLARPSYGGYLISSGSVDAQSGEHLVMKLTTTAGGYDGSGTVVLLNAEGVSLGSRGFYASAGTHTQDINLLCGVDQPSMNVSSYEIYNDTPFYLGVSASVTRKRDAQVARDADDGGGSASDAIEASGGRTFYGALAAVAESHPENGKYWNIHLEKGETLNANGWAISSSKQYGATLNIEVQDQSTGGWNSIASVAPYGKAKFNAAAFTAPSAGNYAFRARCVVNRVCKFFINFRVTGRSLSPCYSGDCSTPMDQTTNELPVNLANGREQSSFGTDLSVANPVGPDVNFGRRWLQVLSLQRVGSPGLARGWMHSYDIRLLGDDSYNLQIQFAGGGLETWTATLDANGQPTGELKPPPGAPYRVQGVKNPVQTDLDQTDPDAADYLNTDKWSSVELIWDDGSQWSFKPGLLRYFYQLERQANSTGQFLQFAYDAETGVLQTVKNQDGTTLLTLNYDGAFLANATDVYGRRVAYTWAQPAGLPKVVLTAVSLVHAVGASPLTYQQYGYWPFAAEENKPLLQSITTRSPNGGNGVTNAYNSYDAMARVASTTDGNGNVHQYSYLPGSTFITVKNAGGQTVMVWTKFYDAQGRDTGLANASNQRWTIHYDDANNPLKPTRTVDPMGRTTRTTYDIYGHVTSTTSPRGVTQIATWSYGNWSLGRLTQTQTQASDGTLYAPTSYSYFEPSGLIEGVYSPHPEAGGGIVETRFTYDAYGNPLSISEPDENNTARVTTLDYLQDGAYSRPMFVGRPLAVTDNLGHTTHLRYDARGNVTSNTDAARVTTDFAYNLTDQVTRVTLPASGQTGNGRGRTDYTYYYVGGPMRSQITRNERDSVVRLVTQIYGNEGELKAQTGDQINQSVTYDAMYRVTQLFDGNSNPTNYYYNSNGYATATQYPGGDAATGYNMERTTVFDASGLPLQTVDGRGVVTNIGYTPDGLPETISYPASPGENVTLSYNVFGQPTGRADASGEELYAYNNRGLMTSQSTRYRNAAGNLMNSFVQTSHFHASGALAQLATSLGSIGYTYDAAGRLTAMQDPDGDTTAWGYDVRDQLQSQILPTGTRTDRAHNVLGQITGQRHAKPLPPNATTSEWVQATLSAWGHPTDATQKQLYNALGQLARSTTHATSTYTWSGTTNYAYNSYSQLRQESSTRGAGYNSNFGYNGAGNPTYWKGQTRTYNTNSQETTGNAFLYDGAGNTIQLKNYNFATPTTPAPTQTLIYNAQGQLAELRDAANALIAKYVYRGDGKRAWKELANGQRSYSYYAGEQMIAATNGNDVASLQLWGADGIVGSRTVNSTTNTVTKTYNLYDPQGNLAQTLDASGNVVGQSAVSAWGEPIRDGAGNSSGGGYGAKFGYVRDGESGFYLCTLRYYDPSAGRWITRDPIGYAGGTNLYGYVGNDPVNMTDPSGLIPNHHQSKTLNVYGGDQGPSVSGWGWTYEFLKHSGKSLEKPSKAAFISAMLRADSFYFWGHGSTASPGAIQINDARRDDLDASTIRWIARTRKAWGMRKMKWVVLDACFTAQDPEYVNAWLELSDSFQGVVGSTWEASKGVRGYGKRMVFTKPITTSPGRGVVTKK